MLHTTQPVETFDCIPGGVDFNTLLAELNGILQSAARRMCTPATTPDDMYQEGLMILLEVARSEDREFATMDDFVAFFKTCLWNKLTDKIRFMQAGNRDYRVTINEAAIAAGHSVGIDRQNDGDQNFASIDILFPGSSDVFGEVSVDDIIAKTRAALENQPEQTALFSELIDPSPELVAEYERWMSTRTRPVYKYIPVSVYADTLGWTYPRTRRILAEVRRTVAELVDTDAARAMARA